MQLTGLGLNSLCRIPPSPGSCPCDLLLKRLAACPSGSSQLAVACSPWGCGFFFFFSFFFCSCELVLETWSGSDCLDEAVAAVLALHHACCLCAGTWVSVAPQGLWGVASRPRPPSTFWLVPPRRQAFPPQAFAAPRSPFTDGFSLQGTCLLAP